MKNNNYASYKLVDFLKDTDFLRWQLLHAEEDERYWASIIAESPELGEIVSEAVSLYQESVKFNDYQLPQEEIEEEYTYFIQSVQSNKKQLIRKLLYWTSAAACIIVVALSVYWLKQHQNSVSYVHATKEIASIPSDEIILMIGDSSVVLPDESKLEYAIDGTVKIGDSEDNTISTGEHKVVLNKIIIPKGKRSSIILADNSKVWLNGGTIMEYPSSFTKDKREIYVNGEIFIKVTSDKNHPFIVKTKGVDVQVLGTEFNVLAYEEDANEQIVLVEGSVEVENRQNKSKTTLKPSQLYDYSNGTEIVKRVDVTKYISWKDGIYSFDNEKLDVVLNRLSRYYGIAISYDSTLANERCSGKMDLRDNLDDVFKDLSFLFPISVKRIDGKYFVDTKKPS